MFECGSGASGRIESLEMSKVNGVFSDVRRVFDKTHLDTVILFVTNACNLRCWFCCSSRGQ